MFYETELVIEESRNKIKHKLADPSAAMKLYWSILRSFLSDIRNPVVPHVFVNGKFTAEMKDKCDYFNIPNSSTLPKAINKVAGETLEYITFNENDMKIISALDVKKAHNIIT